MSPNPFTSFMIDLGLLYWFEIMVQALPAKDITLDELTEKFGLELVEDEQFFREWRDDLHEFSEDEQRRLDRVKASYSNLLGDPPLLENTVKMIVLSPLLDLAGFYLPPFRIKSEQSIIIALENEEVLIKGQIDVLAIFNQFWVVVIESKQAAFSLEVGRPQVLTYMLTNPHLERVTYGLILNGSSFRFLKLLKGEIAQYSMSRVFDLFNPGNDLYQVLGVLKRLASLGLG
ncbi:MAG: restriction endonuclease subunit R [Microcoleaceae cyanobacterium]